MPHVGVTAAPAASAHLRSMATAEPDLYAVLGVSRSAKETEVRARGAAQPPHAHDSDPLRPPCTF